MVPNWKWINICVRALFFVDRFVWGLSVAAFFRCLSLIFCKIIENSLKTPESHFTFSTFFFFVVLILCVCFFPPTFFCFSHSLIHFCCCCFQFQFNIWFSCFKTSLMQFYFFVGFTSSIIKYIKQNYECLFQMKWTQSTYTCGICEWYMLCVFLLFLMYNLYYIYIFIYMLRSSVYLLGTTFLCFYFHKHEVHIYV